MSRLTILCGLALVICVFFIYSPEEARAGGGLDGVCDPPNDTKVKYNSGGHPSCWAELNWHCWWDEDEEEYKDKDCDGD